MYTLLPMAALFVAQRFPDDSGIDAKRANLVKFLDNYCGYVGSTLIDCATLRDPDGARLEPDGKIPAWRQKGFDSVHGNTVGLWGGPLGGAALRSNPDYGVSIATAFTYSPPVDSWDTARVFGGFGYSTTPAVGYDGTVYVTSRAGRVSAVGSNGREKWSFSVPSKPVLSSPALFADYLIFQASPGVVYVLDTVSGQSKYSTNVGQVPTCSGNSGDFASKHVSSPVLSSAYGDVYIGVCSSLVMLRINVSSNTVGLMWRASTRGDDGSVVFGSPAVVNRGSVVWASSKGWLYLTNRATGAEIWSLLLPAGVLSSPSVSLDGESIYVTTTDAQLRVVNAQTGTVAYSTPLADWRDAFGGNQPMLTGNPLPPYAASPAIAQVQLGEVGSLGSRTRARGVSLHAVCWRIASTDVFRWVACRCGRVCGARLIAGEMSG
jgi:outer membrane protein assembly factor BamB